MAKSCIISSYFRESLPIGKVKSLYIVLLKPVSTTQLFSNLGTKYFSSTSTWLVKTGEEEIFQGVYLPITSQVYSFNKVLEDVVVKESYNVAQGLKLWTKQIGLWRERKLSWDQSTVFERRKDFYGYQFEAVTMPESPINIVYTENSKISLGGYFGNVWHLLEKHMNFTTRIRMSPDGNWGSRDENGTWNGMIQEVHEKRSHLGIAAFSFTKERSEVVEFSPPLFKANILMFLKYPERRSSWTTFIEPFDPYLWFSLCVLILLLSLSVSATYQFGPEKTKNPGSFIFSLNFLLILGAQMGQGSAIEPKSFSTRIVFITNYLLGVVILASYSSKMVAFLSTVKLHPEIETLEEVPGSDFKFGYLKGTATSDMFKKAQEGTIFQKIFDEKVKQNPGSLVDNYSEVPEKVLNEKYIFVGFAPSVIELIECEILPLSTPVRKDDIGYVWSKDLPHGQFFTHYINKIGEEGVLDKFRRQHSVKPRSDCTNSDMFMSVGFVNIISAFAMLLVANIVGLMLCIAECLWKYFMTENHLTPVSLDSKPIKTKISCI